MTGVPSSLNVHELLTERDFVHRLARSLVFDQDRVDDVVQEAWLAAMHNPPQQRAAVAGWFRSVVGNLARRRARDEQRRRAREAEVARPEALPSADAVLVREQQRREVVDAVLALAEPYRGTVIARFFDDLAPSEIARRRGVAAATVRSQLKRGLEMLRERLAERHGDPRQWGLWLLSFARPTKATGLALTSIAGGLLMAKLLLGCGLLALLVFGFLTWQTGVLPTAANAVAVAPPSAAATAAANAPAAAAPVAAPIERTSAAPPQPVEPRPRGGSGLRGRVVQPDGTPVPGQQVRALGIDGVSMFADAPPAGDGRSLVLQRGSATTDGDGVFVIHGLASRTRYAVQAAVDGPDRTMRMVEATPLPGETVDIGDFVLVPKGSITGRAVDDAGEGVADAEVLALDLPAALLAAVPLDRFDPRHGGMLSVPLPHVDGDPVAHATELRRFLGSDLLEHADLDKREDLTTLVLDHLPWAEQLWDELPIARTRTAADGTFTVRGVEPGGNLLVVRRPGLASGMRSRVPVRKGEVHDVGDVRLPAGEEFTGRVLDAGGAPLASAEVRAATIGLLGYRGIGFCEVPVRTRADGSFTMPGMGRGRVFVAARAQDGAPWHVVGPVAVDGAVEITMPVVCSLDLALHRADGGAVGAVQVELFVGPLLAELRRAGLQQQLPVPALHADARGVVHVGDLPAGCYALVVHADGAVPAEVMVTLPQHEPLAVPLTGSAPHDVRVQTTIGQPIVGAEIYLARGDASSTPVMPTDYGLARWRSLPTPVGRSDANGELRVDGCPTTSFTIIAMHESHAAGSIVTVPGSRSTTLVLPACGEITGQLFDHGVPADAQRYCITVEGESDAVPVPPVRARLRADGTFAIGAVAPGDYTVAAEPVRSQPLSLKAMIEALQEIVMPMNWNENPTQQRVAVAAGGTATVRFDVDVNQPDPGQLAGRLRGRVSEDGVPFAGAEIDRLTKAFTWTALTTVGADGSFVVDALREGPQRLRLREKGQRWAALWEGSIDVKAGAETVLDLTWTTAPLRGSVAFLPGLPSSDYYAEAVGMLGGGELTRRVAVDATGAFQFQNLPIGDYRVSADGPDGRSSPVPVHVSDGATPPVWLELKETLALRGRLVGGLPPDGAMILLRGDNVVMGTGFGEQASFGFSNLEPHVYQLEVHQGDRVLKVEPSSFDLSLGSQRDIALRVVDDVHGR